MKSNMYFCRIDKKGICIYPANIITEYVQIQRLIVILKMAQCRQNMGT